MPKAVYLFVLLSLISNLNAQTDTTIVLSNSTATNAINDTAKIQQEYYLKGYDAAKNDQVVNPSLESCGCFLSGCVFGIIAIPVIVADYLIMNNEEKIKVPAKYAYNLSTLEWNAFKNGYQEYVDLTHKKLRNNALIGIAATGLAILTIDTMFRIGGGP